MLCKVCWVTLLEVTKIHPLVYVLALVTSMDTLGLILAVDFVTQKLSVIFLPVLLLNLCCKIYSLTCIGAVMGNEFGGNT